MIKVLHIASFIGNVGDNASHQGFYSLLGELDLEYSVTQLEIRKSYNNYIEKDKLNFDLDFVHFANKFDLVVVGGGGFLDYWVEGSATGTTFNIELELLDKIEAHILFTSIGCSPSKKVPKENYRKFELFFKFILNKNNMTVALRNDGSHDSLRRHFPLIDISLVPMLLDHAFFYQPNYLNQISIDGDYVCINITNDQLEMYNDGRKIISKDWYHKELATLVESLALDLGYKIVFVAHIHSDVIAISELMPYLSENVKRENLIIAPYYQGDRGADLIFGLYANSSFVIGSRYHCNVCSMVSDVATVGLSPLKRIQFIHEQLSLSDSYFFIEPGFAQKILSLDLESVLIDKAQLQSLKKMTLSYYRNLFSNLVNIN